ncbi:MAG: manganese efflux pump [Deltaproteobacteria bacterium]|nr:manganese efflux pump [Deltaproteobacteria bacterium]
MRGRRIRFAAGRHGGASVDTLTLLGIAAGLAMDALAVAIATGIVLGKVSGRQTFRLAWHFGLFQFMMPVIGWQAGLSVVRYFSGYGHWMAFGLLAFIGGKMIYDAFRENGEEDTPSDPTRGVSLVVLSVATSVDALAAGLSLGVLRLEIWYPAVVIGVVACVFTAAGMHLGAPLGRKFGRKMEVAGGLVLIGIGIRILFRM